MMTKGDTHEITINFADRDLDNRHSAALAIAQHITQQPGDRITNDCQRRTVAYAANTGGHPMAHSDSNPERDANVHTDPPHHSLASHANQYTLYCDGDRTTDCYPVLCDGDAQPGGDAVYRHRHRAAPRP